jgi:CDP-diacylglycerol--glycerol-3-phosphate 3-phosphatidyltransferase
MKERLREVGRRLLDPVARGLNVIHVSPDQVTFMGLILSLLAGAALAYGRFPLATLLLVAGSLCDVIDGSLARLSGRSSRFGAFLDSTIDRYAEMAVFMGLGLYYAREADLLSVALVFVVATGAMLVSYARARAEGIGLECKVGLMERPERLVILIAGAALGPSIMRILLWVLAVLVHFTALQRVFHVRMLLGRKAE